MALDISSDFQKALNLLENSDKHLFITGKAGTGKSTLLKHFRDITSKNDVVLAPTGVAAVNVQGQTIHSFFKFQPSTTEKDAVKIARINAKNELYTNLEMIIIDEISMVRADMIDCINTFLQTVRKSKIPFGGIQMVFIGDLFQLPPVVTFSEKEIFSSHYPSPFFFDAHAMQELFLFYPQQFERIELEKIYRQKDSEFVEILNGIRTNTITPEKLQELNTRYLPYASPDEEYIYLTTTNANADEINSANLQSIKQGMHKFVGKINGEFKDKDLPTDLELYLKVGARVMFLNNDPQNRWINGTLGIIVKIDGKAIQVELDDGSIQEVTPFTWSNYESRFDKETGNIENEEIGSFTQMPLRLAWAITIHKSQGKTFDKVVIDLGRGSFAHGQTYVALSRCRTLEGIILKQPVKPSDIKTDTSILRFLYPEQYANVLVTTEEKIAELKKYISSESKIEITYQTPDGITAQRLILPINIEEMEYNGHSFMGVEAFSFDKNMYRVFNISKITAIQKAEEQ